MNLNEVGFFEHAWVWGVPLIAVTVVIHVLGLGLIRLLLGDFYELGPAQAPARLLGFATFMGLTVTLITTLHVVQAIVWALAYLWLGALTDSREAILYSLNALTSFGHTQISLPEHWQVLGALEALNGIMMFTLSGAFLFGMIQRAWPRAGD
ncbi:hypothetical protein KTR66_01365 [Roseococcus sp. SDR]|uniref:hypothetical protein n=1 Tax=Roseococcus sp. SDR TaxID=2835532 RepID=UPI001BCD1D78|nr:hypothetical protein [Roseococcus sp. SDR]MBS7788620.1 hypothetical protein [Roseococcus sp. SDR]MBV1843934.1 hypothetical protein [Roseococcus sp. SDR]